MSMVERGEGVKYWTWMSESHQSEEGINILIQPKMDLFVPHQDTLGLFSHFHKGREGHQIMSAIR